MEERTKLACDFITQQPLGVLATIGEHGTPETAAVYGVVADNLDIYFLSPTHTRKLKNLEQRPSVSITFLNESSLSTLQVQGTATVLCTPVSAIMFNKIPKSIVDALLNIHTGLSGSELTPAFKTGGTEQYFVKITPTWMRLAHFKASNPADMYTMIVGK